MKKIMLIVLGVLVSGAVVWAVTSVDGVVEKKDSSQICSNDPNDQECHKVSFDDFNHLVDVTRGIFNTGSGNTGHKIGINIESYGKKSSLIVKDLILIKPGTQKPTCDTTIEGSIFAESGNDNHLWGCNGTDWVQLDTNTPVCN